MYYKVLNYILGSNVPCSMKVIAASVLCLTGSSLQIRFIKNFWKKNKERLAWLELNRIQPE